MNRCKHSYLHANLTNNQESSCDFSCRNAYAGEIGITLQVSPLHTVMAAQLYKLPVHRVLHKMMPHFNAAMLEVS